MAEKMGPIQTIPQSLSALLNLKTRGTNPDVLNGDVQAVVELQQFWQRAKRLRWPTIPAQTTGLWFDTYIDFPASPVVVPNSEWWYVHHITITALVLNAEYVRQSRLAYLEPPTTPLRTTCYGDIVDFNNTGATAAVIFAHEGIWIPPGSTLGVYLGAVPAGVDFSLRSLEYTPLPLFS